MAEEKRRAPRLLPLPKHRHRNQRAEPRRTRRVALDAGQKIFPAYRSSFESAFSVAWHRVQYNLGGWAEWNDKNRASAYPVLIEGEGRVLLAGEHLSYLTGWQAGAIESAWQQIAKIHERASA